MRRKGEELNPHERELLGQIVAAGERGIHGWALRSVNDAQRGTLYRRLAALRRFGYVEEWREDTERQYRLMQRATTKGREAVQG